MYCDSSNFSSLNSNNKDIKDNLDAIERCQENKRKYVFKSKFVNGREVIIVKPVTRLRYFFVTLFNSKTSKLRKRFIESIYEKAKKMPHFFTESDTRKSLLDKINSKEIIIKKLNTDELNRIIIEASNTIKKTNENEQKLFNEALASSDVDKAISHIKKIENIGCNVRQMAHTSTCNANNDKIVNTVKLIFEQKNLPALMELNKLGVDIDLIQIPKKQIIAFLIEAVKQACTSNNLEIIEFCLTAKCFKYALLREELTDTLFIECLNANNNDFARVVLCSDEPNSRTLNWSNKLSLLNYIVNTNDENFFKFLITKTNLTFFLYQNEDIFKNFINKLVQKKQITFLNILVSNLGHYQLSPQRKHSLSINKKDVVELILIYAMQTNHFNDVLDWSFNFLHQGFRWYNVDNYDSDNTCRIYKAIKELSEENQNKLLLLLIKEKKLQTDVVLGSINVNYFYALFYDAILRNNIQLVKIIIDNGFISDIEEFDDAFAHTVKGLARIKKNKDMIKLVKSYYKPQKINKSNSMLSKFMTRISDKIKI